MFIKLCMQTNYKQFINFIQVTCIMFTFLIITENKGSFRDWKS